MTGLSGLSVPTGFSRQAFGGRGAVERQSLEGLTQTVTLIRQEDECSCARHDHIIRAQSWLHHADRPVRQPQQMADLMRDRETDDMSRRERRQRWIRAPFATSA